MGKPRSRGPPDECFQHYTMGTKSTSLLQLFLTEHCRIIWLIGRIIDYWSTANDLAQDVSLRIWERSGIDHHRNFYFRTAQSLPIDHLRAQNVHAGYADGVVSAQNAIRTPRNAAVDLCHHARSEGCAMGLIHSVGIALDVRGRARRASRGHHLECGAA